jgi:hypothetical protein
MITKSAKINNVGYLGLAAWQSVCQIRSGGLRENRWQTKGDLPDGIT